MRIKYADSEYEIGGRINRLRKCHHLNQREFSKRIMVTQATVSAYELGKMYPSNRVIATICHEFGVTPQWLMDGEGDVFSEKNAKNIDFRSIFQDVLGQPAICAFLVAWSRMNKREKRVLEDFIPQYREEYRRCEEDGINIKAQLNMSQYIKSHFDESVDGDQDAAQENETD